MEEEKEISLPYRQVVNRAETGRATVSHISKSVEYKGVSKRIVFTVEASKDVIKAKATMYPYGHLSNHFYDIWKINLSYSKAWAKVSIEGGGRGWARRGSMDEYFIDAVAYVRKAKAREFANEIYDRLERAEDETFAVKIIFDSVKEFVEQLTGMEEEDEL